MAPLRDLMGLTTDSLMLLAVKISDQAYCWSQWFSTMDLGHAYVKRTTLNKDYWYHFSIKINAIVEPLRGNNLLNQER